MTRCLALMAALSIFVGCAITDNLVDRAEFQVRGEKLLISGQITSQTPANFKATLAANPQITTVVQTYMPGSLDDEALIEMGYLLRSRGLNTHLTANSEIYSGAVDLFLAGNRRTAALGAVVGVHSWADGLGEGANYPAEAPEHRLNVQYTTDMLGSPDFYWFTLRAAPSDDIYEMTREELIRFGVITQP